MSEERSRKHRGAEWILRGESGARPGAAARLAAGALSVWPLLPLLALLAALSAASPAGAAAGPERIAPSAQQQIEAVLRDKAALSPELRKLDTRLMIEVRRQRQDPSLSLLPVLRTGIAAESGGRIAIDLRGQVTDSLQAAIEALGGTVENAHPAWGALRARVPLSSLEKLAARPEVSVIRPAETLLVHGNTTITQGDVAHRTNVARTQFGIDGTGITACAMSDSVDQLANLQAAGELPPGVTVLAGQSGNPGSSEGTALMEIMHDLAPGADLAFATGQGGQAQMAQNILDLAAAGCDVINDDVFYFGEPPFQDGIIAQAVDQVAGDGVLYFSSAGNSGRLNAGTSGVWEGLFSPTALPGPLVGTGLAAHDFGGGQNGNQVTEQALNDAPFFTLWWSDPLGGAGNDYDLFLLDDALTTVVAFSAFTQDGDDDPFEIIDSAGVDHSDNRLVVVQFAGEDRFLQLNTHRGLLELATDGQITGHAAAEGAFAVAAVNVASAGGGEFTGGAANPVEPFSSDGPRRIFFNSDGSPVAGVVEGGGQSSVVRLKPDVCAADGVDTETPGFMPFFGTSASVPHAAGISALIRDAFPFINPDNLEQVWRSALLDIEGFGFDRDSGFGLIDTTGLIDQLNTPIFADGFESGNTSAWTSN